MKKHYKITSVKKRGDFSMIEKFCNFLTKKIQKKMPEIDDERAEIIQYGLEVIIGETPKLFILLGISILLGVWQLALISFVVIGIYRGVSGGFHLKTHIGCIISTLMMYLGNVFLSKYCIIEPIYIKYIITFGIWIFSFFMIKFYAPADTENVPIISKKERKRKKILSYIIMTIFLLSSVFIKDQVISNLFLYGVLIQTLTITRIAYKVTNNKYGHEEYERKEVLTSS